MSEFDREEFLRNLNELREKMENWKKSREEFEKNIIEDYAKCFLELNSDIYKVDHKSLIEMAKDEVGWMAFSIYSSISGILYHYLQSGEEGSYLKIDFEKRKKEENERKEEQDRRYNEEMNKILEKLDPEKKKYFIESMAETENDLKEMKKYETTLHNCLKKTVTDFFPEIVDLPGVGLREIDYILFYDSFNLNNDFHKMSKKL